MLDLVDEMTTLEDFLKLNKNRKIWTISKDQSVKQALILMSEKNISAILIVDNNDFPIGIFSERDYARKIILKGKSSKDTLLDEVMTKELITVTRDYKVDQCMEIMNEKKIRHLPVLENKKIIDIISIRDVLKIMIKEQKELIDHLQKFITS
jgi:CBS domain-containing protein